ncbi:MULTISPECIES: helix-turn-helix domain-containing protein [unclassified Streptomyces]|uniref:winged helix-turn-helix domain-containing protein n=1 Tax=unclassified Streptomyces TaxID=2593676 RepID=UPI000CD5C19C|nr:MULTISPECIES: helix-turn-helix domain-containing protein [unclassified Streptomyces]
MPSTDPAPGGRQPRSEVRLDAKGLRALAHPHRVRLLGLLRRHGPSTATRLADRLDINSGSASYHLRQLADAGFVAEDQDRGNARERWWVAVHESTRFDDHDLLRQEPEATMAYVQAIEANYSARLRKSVTEYPTMPRVWQEVYGLSDIIFRLTPEEGASLRDDIAGIIGRYRLDRPGSEEDLPEGAERVEFISIVLPDPQESHEADDPASPDGGPAA